MAWDSFSRDVIMVFMEGYETILPFGALLFTFPPRQYRACAYLIDLIKGLVKTREIYNVEKQKLNDKYDSSHSPGGKIISPLQVSSYENSLISNFAPLLEV